jgi:HK97 gp10 family phage protein
MKVTITGIADVNRILREIAPNEAKNLLRATTADLAKEMAKRAKTNAPVDGGALVAAIGSKRARGDRNTVAAEATVNRDAAYYWRFLEYGQGPDGVEHAYWLRAFQSIKPEIDGMYMTIFGKKLEARLGRLARSAARVAG